MFKKPAAATALFAELRESEFSRLDAAGATYLDYTGSGLYPESLVREHARFLETAVVGNPHSGSATVRTNAVLEEARHRVLAHVGADPAAYAVAFTANASAAIKLVGESFPFCTGSQLLLATDNHNSVNGTRELARRRGATVRYWDLDAELRLVEREFRPVTLPSLFAYPAQSNFSGVQHPLQLIAQARDRGWRVLLDAAAFVPTNRLDLSVHSPDFVAISFYKMMGFPTGIGALVARRDALAELERPWFGGGTVLYASVQNDTHRLLTGADAFHDGTPNFLALPAVSAGLEFLDRVGIEEIHGHVQGLCSTLLGKLRGMVHRNGRSVVRLYGPETTADRGATIAFNILNHKGDHIPYEVVEAAAARDGISVRGGCFCNPGASETAFGLEPAAMQRCFERLGADFTPQRLATCLGKPAGAIRLSLGMASNGNDLERIASFLQTFTN